jgi:hypothetical protein
MEAITKLLDKISAYQVVNYIIPGSVLCVLLKHIVGYDIIAFSMIENVIICYFVGLVNSRLGSLILRPILKKCRLVEDAPYDDFVSVEKYDAKLTMLSDINNVFRSFASVMLVLLIAYSIKHIEIIEKYIITNFNWIAILFLLILFVFSIRKQTKFVKDRVEANKKCMKM